MKCPVCDVDLSISDKQGIEIDYCPKCRGIWLDRGELDKIIERSSRHEPEDNRYDNRTEKDRYYDDDYKYKNKEGYRKKKSFFDDIFDF